MRAKGFKMYLNVFGQKRSSGIKVIMPNVVFKSTKLLVFFMAQLETDTYCYTPQS